MACPFVALESDRDLRSDEPDHRHRCYAEPDPAPRALAHQREYCLTAAFTTCPIFQDWAVRAGATPVPLRPGMVADGEHDRAQAWAAGPSWLGGEGAEDQSELEAEGEGFVGPPTRSSESGAESEGGIERLPSLPLGDGQAQPAVPPPARKAQAGAEPSSVTSEPPTERNDRSEPRPAREPDTTQPERPPPAQAPAPAFLAGREERASSRDPSRQQSRPARLPAETLRREDVVPPWGREPLRGLKTRSKVDYGDSGSWMGRLTKLLAISAILALAVAAVILLPDLLSGVGGTAQGTPPLAATSPSPPAGQPTPTLAPTPTPAASPRLYTVQAGDTLFLIARRHGLTVEQLMLANPQLSNPDLVQIGLVLIIPDDDFGLFSPPAPSP
jgi:nucleoid-associated protein YgaU